MVVLFGTTHDPAEVLRAEVAELELVEEEWECLFLGWF